MNAQRVKKGAAQVKWEAGLPLTGDDVREFMGDKADELIHVEEVKSIGRAIRRDRSYGACVMGNGETSVRLVQRTSRLNVDHQTRGLEQRHSE